eukprot:TRINITY_DN27041_c0_g2_i1.p1 TRINITY_DN27041_c0_g2~~TRINITY_DN27041_c0_g2_i1.p1  ORF type:complete len:202 (-),score=43.37 TRINITY_DN27041_c0_g2_i1:38-643(-)
MSLLLGSLERQGQLVNRMCERVQRRLLEKIDRGELSQDQAIQVVECIEDSVGPIEGLMDIVEAAANKCDNSAVTFAESLGSELVRRRILQLSASFHKDWSRLENLLIDGKWTWRQVAAYLNNAETVLEYHIGSLRASVEDEEEEQTISAEIDKLLDCADNEDNFDKSMQRFTSVFGMDFVPPEEELQALTDLLDSYEPDEN